MRGQHRMKKRTTHLKNFTKKKQRVMNKPKDLVWGGASNEGEDPIQRKLKLIQR